MSASPMARQATLHPGIPTRRVVINSENEMPTDYGTTPGGTIFGTTPGGTKIIYERAFLMKMRNSPLARTPPANLPVIPGVTAPKDANRKSPEKEHKESDMTHHLSTVTGVHFANFLFIITNSFTKNLSYRVYQRGRGNGSI